MSAKPRLTADIWRLAEYNNMSDDVHKKPALSLDRELNTIIVLFDGSAFSV